MSAPSIDARGAQILPYGSWPSPITADLIVADAIGLGDIQIDGEDIYWIEGRPQENGRQVLVRRAADGAPASDVTPSPFSARSRVHEYGGGSATVADGTVYFTNFADQRLYRQRPGKSPVSLTRAPLPPVTSRRYADGVVDRGRGIWIGVRETHDADGTVANALVAVDIAGKMPERVIAEGADFYSSPRLSPDGARLAWLCWNHPNMPWVGTDLFEAALAADGTPGPARHIAGGAAESIFQPEWSPDGRLAFVSDRSGWWNLYLCEAEGGVRALYPLAAEFGQAQWGFGMSSYAFLDGGRIACAYRESGIGRLAILDIRARTLSPLDLAYSEFGALRAAGGRILARAGAPDKPSAILRIAPETGAIEILRRAMAEDPAIGRYFSLPRALAFPTEDGLEAHAQYYAPSNPDCTAPQGEAPPLIVKCHGGPTSAASRSLDLRVQYWTSRGVAVLDVDYGGSTGYGRAYRERLFGGWGVVDVDDCVNAARHVVAQGWADGARAVITGGSAGGYTTLAALAFRDVFKGGASYYGVSDIAALARDTHKFESRYLDWLVGPYPECLDRYRARSPVFHAERLRHPVIFFQGEDDRVVPPSQTEMMVDALRRNGVPVGYMLFRGESHGFRRGDNIKRALEAELAFYAALIFETRLTF